jgi:hypothetical protein
MKASIKIHVETLWTNRAELQIEAELDNPHSETNQQVVSMMFEAARLMAAEARGENERALFGQEAINRRYRELDERELRLDERDRRVTERETATTDREHEAAEQQQYALAERRRTDEQRLHTADLRGREQLEVDLDPAQAARERVRAEEQETREQRRQAEADSNGGWRLSGREPEPSATDG